jgi:uncharacterized protein YndB with AHSA1/START domain
MNHTTEFVIPDDGQEVIVRRTFDAPRALIFNAHVDPAVVPRWWGPRHLSTEVDVLDARPGGMWRFVNRDSDGELFAFHGVFHTVTAPERLVFTFEFEGATGGIVLRETVLEERAGKTYLTDRSVFLSRQDRTEMIGANMESGLRESMDRLNEVVDAELSGSVH